MHVASFGRAVSRALVATVLVVGLGACGVVDRTGTPVTQSPVTPVPGDTIVWQVTDGPGFTSMEIAYATQPEITVYADGRVLVAGAPYGNGPVVPVQQARLTQSQVDRLRRGIADSGLFLTHAPDLGMPRVSDAGTTYVTGVDASGHARKVGAYALSIGDPTGSSRQQELRAELKRLIAMSKGLVHDATPYEPERLLVVGLSARPASPTAMPWPGPPIDDLIRGNEDGGPTCRLLPVSATEAVYAAALRNETYTWSDHGLRFEALVKVAIPGTNSCP